MYEIQPKIFTLSNGIRVVYLHAPSQVAHLGITVLGGSRFEKEGEEGLAHFLEHCIFNLVFILKTVDFDKYNLYLHLS